ncbi:hypothetical protein LINPERHAP1_LOCUS5164, partial [Linum perenne]
KYFHDSVRSGKSAIPLLSCIKGGTSLIFLVSLEQMLIFIRDCFAKRMTDFWPISCCNVVYKCITKVMSSNFVKGS